MGREMFTVMLRHTTTGTVTPINESRGIKPDEVKLLSLKTHVFNKNNHWMVDTIFIKHFSGQSSITVNMEYRVHYMNRIMRKPAFCICENKDADQLRVNREADQRLCFRYIDSTIPLLPVYPSQHD